MDPKASTTHDVDNRRHGMKGAVDDTEGKRALAKALAERRIQQRSTFTEDSKEDGHFIASGPGDATYKFKNAFGAPRSPTQRRLEHVNQ
jgi:hypothetical protein